MSNVCSFCQTQESAPAGKWVARADGAGRRTPPDAVYDSRVDNGFASSLGFWAPGSPAPFRCHDCCASDAADRREAAIDAFQNRRDPTLVCKDIFLARPWMAGLRRASPAELRSALLRVKRRLAPANASGLEDALGQGGDVPAGWGVVVTDDCPVFGPRYPSREGGN